MCRQIILLAKIFFPRAVEFLRQDVFDGRLRIGGQFFRARRPLQRVKQIFAAVPFYRLVKFIADESRLKIFVVRERIRALAESYGLPENFFVQRIFFIEAGKHIAGKLRIYAAVSANFCSERQRNQRVDEIYKRCLVEMIFVEAIEQIH